MSVISTNMIDMINYYINYVYIRTRRGGFVTASKTACYLRIQSFLRKAIQSFLRKRRGNPEFFTKQFRVFYEKPDNSEFFTKKRDFLPLIGVLTA